MNKLLQKLSRNKTSDWRQEIERDAADQIKARGSKPPPEVASLDYTERQVTTTSTGDQGHTAPTEAAAGHGADHSAELADEAPAATAPAPARRLTAQQRAAARQLASQGR